MKSRYILYGNDKEGGVWELSPDMNIQKCIAYLEDGVVSPPVSDDRFKSIDVMLDPSWSGSEDNPAEINILTEEEVFLLIL